jgi:hypothetical protein
VSSSVSSRCVGALLRSPAHRLLDGQLVLLTYRGRRSGHGLSVPVAYARDGRDLVVYVGHHEAKQWWRNFEQPEPVHVRLRGAHCAGVARAVRTDRAARVAYERRFPRASRAIDREHVPVFVRISDLRPATAEVSETRGVTA